MKKLKTIEQFKSVSEETINKLVQDGYTIQDIISKQPIQLAEELNITETKASKLIKEAKDNLVYYFESAKDLLERRSKILRLKSGCDAIDKLTRGGLETQAIIEFYGEFGSGKTQITHQLAVMAQRPTEEGGLNGSVLIIDTENTFRPERIKQIAERFNLEPETVLENITVVKPINSDEQITILEKLLEDGPEKLYKFKKPLRLLIIDSIVSKFRSEYIGRGTLSERQQKLNKHLNAALDFARRNNAVVVITNQVMANPDFLYSGQLIKPVGGNIIGHSATYRFYLKKAKENKRVIKVIDAPDLPNEEATYEIFEGGIKNIDE